MTTTNKQLEWLWNNCRIIHFPKADDELGTYPIEHNPFANKDARGFIESKMPQELMGADTELEKRLHLAETERDLYASDAKRCWEHMPDLANSDADYELHEAVHQLVQERNELRVKVNSYKLSADVQTLNEVRKQYVNLREHQFAEWLRVIYLEAL